MADTSVIRSVHHVRLTMPPGRQDMAREFYAEVLLLSEVQPPPGFQGRGGVWFEAGEALLHVAPEEETLPKHEPVVCLLVDELETVASRLSDNMYDLGRHPSETGLQGFYVFDPFGNGLEILQAPAGPDRSSPDRPETRL